MFLSHFSGGPSSSVLSFSSVTSLQYCSDSIVSLCWGLNYSLSTSKSSECGSFSYLLSLSVWTNLSPSWPSQLIIIGYFCFPLCYNCLSWKCFFNFEVVQLNILILCLPMNVGYLGAGPLALGTMCTGLLLLAGSSVPLTAIIGFLLGSVTACIMLCLEGISLYFSLLQLCLIWDCLIWVSLVSLSASSSLLLTSKEDNTIGCF